MRTPLPPSIGSSPMPPRRRSHIPLFAAARIYSTSIANTFLLILKRLYTVCQLICSFRRFVLDRYAKNLAPSTTNEGGSATRPGLPLLSTPDTMAPIIKLLIALLFSHCVALLAKATETPSHPRKPPKLASRYSRTPSASQHSPPPADACTPCWRRS